MSRDTIRITGLVAVAGLCLVAGVLAVVPPPPVNQLIGMPDSIPEALTTPHCRSCHGQDTADRHHILTETAGQPCNDCHQLQWDDGCQCYVFSEFRECESCHFFDPNVILYSPHHNTESAALGHCSDCHGSVVQDFDDDHYIPDYDISEVTPDPNCKTWDGPICTSGGCLACHTGDPGALPVIAEFGELHHEAGLNCMVCHQVHGNIRACEDCHAPDSLHNIQADSDNPDNPGVIIPGEENLGWGHIGNSWDCFGCHESFDGTGGVAAMSVRMAAVTPQTGATVPSIGQVDTESVVAGQQTVITVTGSGFVNQQDQNTLTADVVLSAGADSFVLTSQSVTHDQIIAVVPSTMTVGLYELRVVKGDKKSERWKLTVIPPVVIDTVCNSGNTLQITGAGFSEYPDGYVTDQGISITWKKTTATCTVVSWSDTTVTGLCPINKGTVTLTGIYGSAAAEVGPQCSDGGPGNGDGKEGKGPSCSDGVDNDGDGQIDCADPDCASNKACG
jgi:hypothetical protein